MFFHNKYLFIVSHLDRKAKFAFSDISASSNGFFRVLAKFKHIDNNVLNFRRRLNHMAISILWTEYLPRTEKF